MVGQPPPGRGQPHPPPVRLDQGVPGLAGERGDLLRDGRGGHRPARRRPPRIEPSRDSSSRNCSRRVSIAELYANHERTSIIVTWTRTVAAVWVYWSHDHRRRPRAPGPASGWPWRRCLCVQLGLAVSVDLFDRDRRRRHRVAAAGLGRADPAGRRVRPWRLRFTRSACAVCTSCSASRPPAVTLLFMAAVARLPLGTASALEFLGPLGVAVARGRGRPSCGSLPRRAPGSLLLTEPWHGDVDPARRRRSRWGPPSAGPPTSCSPSGSATRWPGCSALADLDAGGGAGRHRRRRPGHAGPPDLARGAGWRGLGWPCCCPSSRSASSCWRCAGSTTAAFGTLMSLEPALALLVGLVVLRPGAAGLRPRPGSRWSWPPASAPSAPAPGRTKHMFELDPNGQRWLRPIPEAPCLRK